MFFPFVILISAMTFCTFLVYSYDFAVATGQWKHLNRRRIPEFVLMTLSALGGCIGAWIAVKVERHKASAEKRHIHFVIYSSMVMVALVFLILLFDIGG